MQAAVELNRLREYIMDRSYSDGYILKLYGQLLLKNIQWKWDNREFEVRRNPYFAIDNNAMRNYLLRYRPELSRAIPILAEASEGSKPN